MWRRNGGEKSLTGHYLELHIVQCSETKNPYFRVCVCVSHVAVVSLQKQLSVCVQQLYDPQILVDHSHYYLQRIDGLKGDNK